MTTQIDSPLRLTAEDRTHAVQNAKPVAEHVEHVDLTQAAAAAEAPVPADKDHAEQFKDIETVALVVSEPKADFELCPIILDEVRPDEVLIEMKYSGICHTDIVLQQGLLPLVQFPAIFGHEGSGIIRAIGSSVQSSQPDLRVGDRALLSFNTCGECRPCLEGKHPAFCHDHPKVNHSAVRLGDGSTPARRKGGEGESVRSQYFGQSSFSKMSVVQGKCVVKCPPRGEEQGKEDGKDDDLAVYAPIGCGFQTGAGTVMNVLKPGKEDSLVIFGLGSVGLAALMAARYMGVGQIVAVDIVDEKLEMARELGATDLVNSLREAGKKEDEKEGGGGVIGAVKKVTRGGKGGNFAIDCTGIPRVIEDMVECLAPEGTAALVGVPPAGVKVRIDPLSFLLENKKFLGVIEGDSNPKEFIPRLIEMHREGNFPIDKLCRTYPVARLQDAIHDLHAGKVIKPVIDWS